ncbi:MAG TPA: transglutaminase family protein [Syntrophales bacterium]|nr:transglutaminase family protein [Syntrophales bacterium]HON23087.1 transglutaminase family protein [Syntrophales bacterium]HOU77428.1 transglutaminase family protein [Syntrophales bacterium]HPC33592.1 transglutaminase family protein [Syntrophales bacterium]HQG35140.1 transglutaminase family protein [Syntrophales bacterium]
MKSTEEDNPAAYLQPTYFIDSDSPVVAAYARQAVESARTEREKAIRLYNAVRDGIQYDPYRIDFNRHDFRASTIIGKGYGYCVAKAIVLAAAGRAAGIPSRLRFADVRNHLTTERLKKLMKTDLFIYHGYTEFLLDSRWLKVTPTFNSSLCERFRVKPLDFDGEHDAIFHPYDMEGRRHMEYVTDHGSFVDVPYEKIIEMFKTHYGVYFQKDRPVAAGAFEREAATGRR